MYETEYKVYANAIEINDHYGSSGWSDFIFSDKELLKEVLKMIENRHNRIGKKIAFALSNHNKVTVRELCEKILNDDEIKVRYIKEVSF